MSCASYVDLPPRAVGGVENPIRADLPEGQRLYLKKLRTPEGAKVRYEYLDAILGPEGRVLDRFRVDNPAYARAKRSFFQELFDHLRTDPKIPLSFRIYLDMYHPGVNDTRTPPGFRLLESKAAGPDPKISNGGAKADTKGGVKDAKGSRR